MAHRKYELRHFTEDYAATEWINSMDALGYDVVSMATCEVQNGRDRRDRDVQITVLMARARLTPLSSGGVCSGLPPVVPQSPGPLRGHESLPFQEPEDPTKAVPGSLSYGAPRRVIGKCATLEMLGDVPPPFDKAA